ncbi:GntR family transcriptional regulator [Alicyclobacillus fodiniaquatilis]|uniref:GntR family transcriptional regulator n=1 Tax=Alicyclobacillus fodiniaquatilis TaxID=1661150 RepID=A0ABW4JIH8_9BACL
MYEVVKGQILDQQLMPGDKVTIDRIARALNCSSVSVREALTRLHVEGLLQFVPYRGYVVTELLDEKSFRNLYDVRVLLELYAIEKAAVRVNEHDLDELSKILNVTVEADPTYEHYQPFVAVDQAFHRRILELSGNSYLTDLWDSLHIHLHLARFYRKNGYVDSTEGQKEHDIILDALSKHDPVEARRAMKAHLTGSYERLWSGVSPDTNA